MYSNVLEQYRKRTEQVLDAQLPSTDQAPERLHAAMRYSVLNGGKRLRAILVYAAGAALDVPQTQLDGAAASVEIIHAYSLIHDDLPAMDNDDLRRGMPTCHIEFDEATAMLAGDALQTLAFEVLLRDGLNPFEPQIKLQVVQTLAVAIGSLGMAGGQALDLAAVDKKLTLPELEAMHRLKTGALIRASIRMGALCQPGLGASTLAALDRYGASIGLAFQIQDDILDVTGDTTTLGKTQGADLALNKPTYPALLGLAQARKHAIEQKQQALAALQDSGVSSDLLHWLAEYVVERSH